MKPYKGICKECNKEKWISNARKLCDDCVYKRNHNGKSKYEVALEKEKNKPKKRYAFKQSPIKSTEKTKEKRKETLQKDKETYYQVFKSKPNWCEECYLNGITTNLPNKFEDEEGNIVAIYQYSHILSKGSHNEFRHNSKNFNRLCLKCHQDWEFRDKKNMKIYKKNQLTIEQLIQERNGKINK